MEGQFLHACYNAALGDYPLRLCSLRDVAMAGVRLDGDFDSVADLAREWKATAVVRRAADLIRLCRQRVAAARMEVEQVVADLEADEVEGETAPD